MSKAGIWIDLELWELDLSAMERILLAKLSSLDDGGGCWAGDETLANFLRITPQYLRKMRKRLEESGYIERSGYGSTRRLVVNTKPKKQHMEQATIGASNDRNKFHMERKKQQEERLEAPIGASRSNYRSVDYRDTIETTIELTKEAPKKKKEELVYPFESPEFRKMWEDWKEYKKAEHRFTFKTMKTEQASLHKLYEDAEHNEQLAIKAIGNAIASGWKGIFISREDKRELSRRANGAGSPEARDKFREYIETGTIRE